MNNFNNKYIFSKNLKYYMSLHKKTRSDICHDLNFRYSTFADWINEKSYPRIDKIEKLANYFHIQKSNLIEDADTLATKADDLLSYMNKEKLDRVAIIPIYNKLVLVNNKLSEEYIINYMATGYNQIDLNKSEDYFYYKVSDQSLSQKINKRRSNFSP